MKLTPLQIINNPDIMDLMLGIDCTKDKAQELGLRAKLAERVFEIRIDELRRKTDKQFEELEKKYKSVSLVTTDMFADNSTTSYNGSRKPFRVGRNCMPLQGWVGSCPCFKAKNYARN